MTPPSSAQQRSPYAGRTAVVTGAARGIGRALAARLVAEGARVIVNDLAEESTHATAAEIGAHPVVGDLSSEAGVAAVIRAAREHLGTIDVWVGNAGIVGGLGLECGDDEWATAWELNTMAHVRAARLLVPEWLERGVGRFVVTASAAGLLTALGAPAYSVTKHGAVAFAEWLAATYQHRGVIVQAICPEGVQTDMLESSGPMRELLVADGALTPEEVADALVTAGDRFLVLPHPQVADYYRHRAADTDAWLSGMSKLQRHLERPANDKEDRR